MAFARVRSARCRSGFTSSSRCRKRWRSSCTTGKDGMREGATVAPIAWLHLQSNRIGESLWDVAETRRQQLALVSVLNGVGTETRGVEEAVQAPKTTNEQHQLTNPEGKDTKFARLGAPRNTRGLWGEEKGRREGGREGRGMEGRGRRVEI